MMRPNQFAVMLVLAVGLTSGPADAGYVETWLDAHGGCRQYRELVPPPRGSFSSKATFLDKSGEEWTDDMIAELSELYARCASEAMLPAGIPRSQMRVSLAHRDFGLMNARRIRDEFVEPARQRIRDRNAKIEASRRLAEDEDKARIAKAERDTAQHAADALEQERQDTERKARLKEAADLQEANHAKQLAQARDQARRDQEAADELIRQAESEEKHLVELKQINAEAAEKRRAAEERLAKARAAIETENKVAPTPAPARAPTIGKQTTLVEPHLETPVTPLSDPVPVPAGAGCERPDVRQLLMDEFNRAAETKDRLAAIDLTEAVTEEFEGDTPETMRWSCLYEVLLDNARHQRFRLKVQPNSLGKPFMTFQPQGSSYR